MVQCSQLDDNQHQNAPALPDNMASQLESCHTHLADLRLGVRPQEEKRVRCVIAPDCDWLGSYDEVLHHCQQHHPESIWWTGDQERTFTVKDIREDSYQVELVVAHRHLFWLHVKNDLTTGSLYAACQHIQLQPEDPHTKFMIRTELCDASRLNCISCSTETRPHTEDIAKILANHHCAVRSHHRLHNFLGPDNRLSFSVNIGKTYYYQ